MRPMKSKFPINSQFKFIHCIFAMRTSYISERNQFMEYITINGLQVSIRVYGVRPKLPVRYSSLQHRTIWRATGIVAYFRHIFVAYYVLPHAHARTHMRAHSLKWTSLQLNVLRSDGRCRWLQWFKAGWPRIPSWFSHMTAQVSIRLQWLKYIVVVKWTRTNTLTCRFNFGIRENIYQHPKTHWANG